MSNFEQDGFFLKKNVFKKSMLQSVEQELLLIVNKLTKQEFVTVDDAWSYIKRNDRAEVGGALYNSFKHLPSVGKLAASNELEGLLKDVCGFSFPMVVDINCRIDSKDEEHYLFDWHQDYWFSICSKDAVVVWIPVTDIDESLGGLSIISNRFTNSKIYRTKEGGVYRTYADSVLLDEEIPVKDSQCVDSIESGDALIFKFNVLHKSNQVKNDSKSRFTIQIRVVNAFDAEFVRRKMKPGLVSNEKTDYLESKDN